MKLNRTWLLAFTVVLGAILTGAAFAAPAEPIVYSGVVIDEATREPIAGVAVECRFPGDETAAAARAETDPRGRYSFEVAAGCAVALEFVKPGYARWHRGPLVPGKEPWLSGDVVLGRTPESLTPDTGLATGVVRNAATGEPVGGVAVDLCFYGAAHHPDYRTDARGRFVVELPVREDAECQVLVQAVGFLPYTSERLTFAKGRRDHVEVWLVPGKTLVRGVVTDAASGKPVPEARVSVDGPVGSEFLGEAAADAEGFEVEVPPGTVTVCAEAAGYEAGTAEVEVEGGTVGTVRIALLRIDSVVAGTCIDARTGFPAEGAQVQVFGDFWPAYETATDANGAFSLEVPARAYRVLVTNDGYRPALLTGVTPKDGRVTVQIALTPLDAAIVCQIVDKSSGGKVRGGIDVRIEAVDTDIDSVQFAATYPEFEFDPETGGFETAVAPGKFRITIDGSDVYLAYRQEFAVAAMERHALKIELTPIPPRTATIRGTVVAPDGAVVEGLTVVIEYESTSIFQAVLPTGGSFEARVPAGPVLVRACGSYRKGGEIAMLAADVPFEATAGETTEARVKLEEVR